jgi:hypothetical protein
VHCKFGEIVYKSRKEKHRRTALQSKASSQIKIAIFVARQLTECLKCEEKINNAHAELDI